MPFFAVSHSVEYRFIRLTRTGFGGYWDFDNDAPEYRYALTVHAFEVFGTLFES
jgi:hypothetical protein